MPASCSVTVSGHVEEWPPAFADALPAEDWLAVLALPRQDKLLVSALRHRQLPGLMLYERRTRRYRRKGVQEYFVPLLGAWAFVHGADRDRVWETAHAAQVLPVRQEAVFVRELGDMVSLLRRCRTPPLVNPGLVAGTRVRITRGAMAGLCGVVLRRRDHARLVLNLSALGTRISVELPADAAVAAMPVEPEAGATGAMEPLPVAEPSA